MPPVGVAEFVFRVCVNFFFSAMLGFVCWIAGRLILISFFDYNASNDTLAAVIAIGIGAGFGGSVGALMLGLSNPVLALRVLLGVGAGLLGAWLGLLRGMSVEIAIVGMPGIPELGGIVQGALIAANGLPIALEIAAAARRHWRRRRSRAQPPTT